MTANLLALVASALALGSIAGLFGGTPGRLGLGLDFVNHLAPLLLALAVVAAIAGGALLKDRAPRRLVIGCSLVCIVAELGLIIPEAASAFGPRPSGPASLRVMTYNLWELNADPQESARAILSSGADVVTMPEARGRSEVVLSLIARSYPYRANCLSNRWCSLAIASKRPFLLSRFHQGSWLGAHPDRLALVWGITSDRSGRLFTVAVTHLAHPGPDGIQLGQIDRLAKLLQKCRFPGLVLAGDFNLTPWSYALKRQDRSFAPLVRRTRFIPSWPDRWPGLALRAPFPFLPIDHVYTATEWRAVSVRRGARGGSDHYPVIIDLAREEAGATTLPVDHRGCSDGPT